jgi:heptosyltransferase I
MLNHRRPPLSELRAQRIALIKPSALGDVVHTLPILGALRHKFPDAHIAWVVNRAYEPLIAGHFALDETIAFDRSALRGGWQKAARASLKLTRELRRRRFDLVIDLQGLARSGLMTLATGARRRVGLNTAREGAHLAYTDIVASPDPKQTHAIDRYWAIAEALGVGHIPKRFDVPVQPESRTWAREQLGDLPRPWMSFGVGARWLTKRWPPEHFARLAQWAHERFGGTVFFVGAPDEAPLARHVIAQLRGPWRDFVGTTTLQQLAGLLEAADVMVANDTGPLHLAAALNRPCVAPYTCTSIRRHGPYGQAGGIETNVWCKGSYIRTCDRLECMTELVPDRLWPVLSSILSAWASHSRSACGSPVVRTVADICSNELATRST